MADYLQGTALQGLFSQPTNSPYIPGQGMAPYASYPQLAGNSAANSISIGNQAGNVAGSSMPNLFSGGSSLDDVIKAAAPYGQGAIDKAVAAYNSQAATNPEWGYGGVVMHEGYGPSSLNHSVGDGLWVGGGSSGGGGGGGGADGAGGGASGTGQPATGAGGLLSGLTGFGQTGNSSPSGINPYSGSQLGGGGQLGNGQIGQGTTFPGVGQISGTGQIPGSQVGGGAPLSMSQATPTNALNQYYNTAGYQLTNGQGAVNNFQTSPGYQFAVDQALKQVQQQGASRGLLDSGAGLRAMTDRAQGMANQEFNNWQQNQQNQYAAYQNRLQGLASGSTGADMAYGLGQTVGNNAMNTGNNVGSILANQGNSLFGGIVGAGGAQAQNVTAAGNMQAQILAGNLQTQMMLAALAAGQKGV